MRSFAPPSWPAGQQQGLGGRVSAASALLRTLQGAPQPIKLSPSYSESWRCTTAAPIPLGPTLRRAPRTGGRQEDPPPAHKPSALVPIVYKPRTWRSQPCPWTHRDAQHFFGSVVGECEAAGVHPCHRLRAEQVDVQEGRGRDDALLVAAPRVCQHHLALRPAGGFGWGLSASGAGQRVFPGRAAHEGLLLTTTCRPLCRPCSWALGATVCAPAPLPPAHSRLCALLRK